MRLNKLYQEIFIINMRQHLRYFSNIFFMVVFTSYITLALILMSGCSSFKKGGSENIQSQKSASAKTEEKTSTSPENFTASEDEEKEDSHDYSTAAYYYYMKSERHKQNGEIHLAIGALQQAIAIDPDSIYLNKNLVFLHILNKDNTSAMEVAAAMSQKHPDNQEMLVLLAKLKLQFNQVNEAQNLYKKIIKLNPENHDAYIMLGNIYMNNRQNEEAFNLFSAMVKQFPDSYGAHFFLGKLQVHKNNSVQAEKEFLKSIELRSQLLEPRFELISIYKNREAGKVRETSKSRKTSQKNYSQKVVALYEEILKIENNNIKASIELPLYLYKKGEKAKASAMLIDFGQKYQNDDAMMVAMAKELINNDNNDNKNDAVIVFNELLGANTNGLAANANSSSEKSKNSDSLSISSTDNHNRSAIHYLAGLTFDALKESQRAIAYFLRVSPDSEQYKKSVFHIAYIYNKLGQNNKAIAFLEQKLVELPKDTELIEYLATFYEEDKQLDKALDLLQKGLQHAPDDTELLFRSGIVMDKSGDKDGSMAAMKRVIELDSEHASALNYLGYTYAELGINLDEAEELIKRSLTLKPNDGYITDSLGWVYYKKGEYDKAIEILEKAVTLSSGDSVISEHLGDAYKEQKNYSKAIGAYKNALLKNKNPENKSALEKKIHEIETIMKRN